MSKICQITGKKAMVGNNVSHSKRRTKRTLDVNLFTKKFYYVEQDCWISLKISAAGLRLINKVGLDAALNNAVSKGYGLVSLPTRAQLARTLPNDNQSDFGRNSVNTTLPLTDG